jgi:large subunit ribosomal protein L16
MLEPKRRKYQKAHKGRIHGAAKGGFRLSYGAFGLKALQPERITARQIEAARRAITRAMKRQGRLWILILGLPRASRSHHVRNGRCAGCGCKAGFRTGSGEAAD